MAVKKRTNLGTKASIRASKPKESPVQYDLPEDPKAFLHEHKDTKKDKMTSKRKEFLMKLSDKSGDFSGISKSSIRRRKRKQKDELLPKMQDLLTTLDETTKTSEENTIRNDNNKKESKKIDLLQSINIVDSKTAFITNKKKTKNIPNPKNKTGIKLIESEERIRFGSILKDTTFKKSPFASLRENIQNRLKNEGL